MCPVRTFKFLVARGGIEPPTQGFSTLIDRPRFFFLKTYSVDEKFYASADGARRAQPDSDSATLHRLTAKRG